MDVIKIGGAAGVDGEAVCSDVAAEFHAGRRLVLLHGGSDETNKLAEALGHPPRFVTSPSGHQSRLTDERTLEIFTMATALVNRRLVSSLLGHGVRAVGLSGLDGRLVEAERKEAIRVVEKGRVRIVRDDRTGKPVRVGAGLLTLLLDAGYLPVVAPLAAGADGAPLNVDGDRAAALVAGALGADTLCLLTGVPGLLRAFPDESTLVPHFPSERIDDAMEIAEGRMRKKVLGAKEALEAGVARVVIAGTSGERPVAAALAGRGTVLGEPVQPSPEERAAPSGDAPREEEG